MGHREREEFGDPGYGLGGVYDHPRATLAARLEELCHTLLVVLEAAEMPSTRASLIEAWSGFKKRKGGLEFTRDYEEYQTSESPALTYLEQILLGLRITVSEVISSADGWNLNRLEAMLRDTSTLVHRHSAPANEMDVQKIMHDYLSASFPDFRKNPPIGGTLKTFKPDSGIASVGAAIEFKFVRTAEEVAVAASGIFEDSAGYKGSKDWTRFYCVIYQAKPFMLESHLVSDLKRIEANSWKAFVVNGPIDETRASKRAASKKKK
jgi:hypothetical protein